MCICISISRLHGRSKDYVYAKSINHLHGKPTKDCTNTYAIHDTQNDSHMDNQ